MASEIRANQIQSRTGLSTVSFTDSGVSIVNDLDIGNNLDVGNKVNVGNNFIQNNVIGIGSTTTAGRAASTGVSTAIGALVYNAEDGQIQVYTGTAWAKVASVSGGWTVESPIASSGPGQSGVVEYTSGTTSYIVFYDPGTLTVEGDIIAEGALLVGGGGTGGAPGGGGGGAGGLLERDSPFPLVAGTYTIQVGDGAPPVRSSSPANPEGPSGGNIPWLSPTGPIWPGGDTLGTPGQPTYFGTHIAYGGENGGGSQIIPAYPQVLSYPNPMPSKTFAGKPYVPWSPNTSVGSGGALSYDSADSPNLPQSTLQTNTPLFTGYGNYSGSPSPGNGGSGGAGGAGTPAGSGGAGGIERVVPTTLLPDPFTTGSSFPSVFLNVPVGSPSAQRRAFAGGAAAFPDRAGSPYGTGGSGGPSGTQAAHSGVNYRGGGGGGMNTPNPSTTYGYGGKGVVIIKLATADKKNI